MFLVAKANVEILEELRMERDDGRNNKRKMLNILDTFET